MKKSIKNLDTKTIKNIQSIKGGENKRPWITSTDGGDDADF